MAWSFLMEAANFTLLPANKIWTRLDSRAHFISSLPCESMPKQEIFCWPRTWSFTMSVIEFLSFDLTFQFMVNLIFSCVFCSIRIGPDKRLFMPYPYLCSVCNITFLQKDSIHLFTGAKSKWLAIPFKFHILTSSVQFISF